MSAIAGLVQLDNCPVNQAIVDRMQVALTPYGQDSQNYCNHGSVAMVHTLLRTTLEDSLDSQPLVHTASGTTLVFDGRIDNRNELACALGLTAAELALMADSELVLHAYLKWDIQAAEYLLGDFAIACWQETRRRLWLVRDPLGVRPLFWYKHPNFFVFATMPRALFIVPGVHKKLNEEHLHDFLCLLPTPGPETYFQNLYRLEPGQMLLLHDGQITTHHYYRFDPSRTIRLSRDDDYVEAFREHLDQAVSCRLRSSGLIASELSSGFDSSTVTAVAARQLAEQNESLIALTSVPREGFTGPAPKGYHIDEGVGAQALAAKFDNIKHIFVRSKGTLSIEQIHHDIKILDHPTLSSLDLAWAWAIQADAAQRGAKVLLAGAAGNITISYKGDFHLPVLLGRGQWLALWREIQALNRQHPSLRRRHWLRQAFNPYLRAVRKFTNPKRSQQRLQPTDYSPIHPDFVARMSTAERAERISCSMNQQPWADGRVMRARAFTLMEAGGYRVASNIMGLERRDPTADRRLVEFCLSIPESQYQHEGQSRWLLHRLMGDVLPPEILNSATKGLQAADWYEALERSLPEIQSELTRLMAHSSANDYVDLGALLQAIDNWPTSGWEKRSIRKTYRQKLLWGLSVGAFLEYNLA